MADLKSKKVAILATDGFEQSELTSPREALDNAGATTHIVAPEAGKIKGWKHDKWGDEVAVDITVDQANPSDYDALVLPGGVMNPDQLRTQEPVQKFVRQFFEQHKPVAAICHGPWTLIDAGVVNGRKMTSFHTIRRDLENAGANWVDEQVVVDNGLVTSRNPNDLDAFNAKLIEEIAEGKHEGQKAA